VVKHSGHKSTFLRKEPIPDRGASNVLAVVKNGVLVIGDCLLVRRASREAGFVQLRHLKLEHGSSWKIQNADGASTTPLRKQPQDLARASAQEASEQTSVVGYASEGEVVDGDFLWVTKQGEKRGGYMKLCHLRTPRSDKVVRVSTPLPPPEGQRWVVMDASHDGAWLRREPRSERGADNGNVVCLLANGAVVVGDFVHVRRPGGESGLLRLANLEQLGGGRCWRVHADSTVILRREPTEASDEGNTAGHVKEGEVVEGEFVFVARIDRKRSGYVKRRYLTALADPASGSGMATASSAAVAVAQGPDRSSLLPWVVS